MASLQALALSLGLVAVVLFGAAAVAYAWYRRSRVGPDSSEFFLTARHSVGAFTIAWAFYAGAMGSWALFGPPAYPLAAGMLGVIMYSIASGIPILIIGLLGGMVHELVPNVISFGDFVNRRFGLVVSIYVSLIMLFNMGIALTAEFTAVGDLFSIVIGVSRIPIVVTIGVVSIIYTAIGGLYVSIITDQWQASCSLLFILILVIYVACTFRPPGGLGPFPADWGNELGLAAIAVMPISLTSATLFSEAMWQRCWATTNKKALIVGSICGAVMVTCAVFILGFGGMLAIWGGWAPSDSNDTGNTILFTLFNNQTWVLVIVSLLSVVMSESAVDSLQNAIVDTVATLLAAIAGAVEHAVPRLEGRLDFAKNLNMWWIRGLVLALNVVPIIISLHGYSVLQLFLMANLITTTSCVPIFLGVWQGALSRVVVTPFSALLGCASGIASLFWWSAIQAGKQGISYGDALNKTFFFSYDYPQFLIAIGTSIAGVLIGAGLEFAVRRLIPLLFSKISPSSTPQFITSLREYPEYPLGSGLTGQITDSTAEIMAKIHSETSQRDSETEGNLKADGSEAVTIDDGGSDLNTKQNLLNPL